MFRPVRSLLSLIFIFFLTAALFAQTGYKIKTRSASDMAMEQRRAVSAWCRMDYDGFRLSEPTWQQKMRPLTTEKNYSEFPTIYIVSRYEFEPQQGISTSVTVSYTTIGRYNLAFGYEKLPGQDTVTFRVEDKGGEILITDPGTPMPHVAKPAAIQWMKERIESSKSDNEKAQLQEALKILEPTPSKP